MAQDGEIRKRPGAPDNSESVNDGDGASPAVDDAKDADRA